MNSGDILKYAYSNAGIARCFLRDLATMRSELSPVGNIFWLKDAPCIAVKVVAMVVGVLPYEKRTLIWLDDGSAVVETQVKHVEVASTNDSKGDPKSDEGENPPSLMQPQTRIPGIGEIVKVMGKIFNGRDEESRGIRIDFLETATPLEEADHWKQTVELHRSKYSLPFELPDVSQIEVPFTPPRECIGIPNESTPRPAATTPVKQEPAISSPASVRSKASALSHFEDASISIPRLRHPSRLRTSELTLLTFRLYIKSFINYIYTKRISTTSNTKGDPEDHPGRRTRSRITSFASTVASTDGIGLSYLRRIPDLQELAIRVVRAEQRRKEKRRLQQEKENLHRGESANASVVTSSTTKSSRKKKKPDNLKRYIKLLFSQALLTLYQDGLIVPHDGTARRWNEGEAEFVNSSHLWRAKDSKDVTRLDVSAGSTSMGQPSWVSHATVDEEMEISDHDEDEECFVPVTRDLLSEPVLFAIQRASFQRKDHDTGKKSIKSRGAFEEDILIELHNLDSRWDRIYDIRPTLRHLEDAEKIWEVREGCWAIL
ncbi:hypothetical protein CPB86DRAFT_790217 [Serendipita vermifera]|nr:hypothetical protein CPB86DRAFT_790217 [Serendipita vermifera]